MYVNSETQAALKTASALLTRIEDTESRIREAEQAIRLTTEILDAVRRYLKELSIEQSEEAMRNLTETVDEIRNFIKSVK